MISDKIDFLNHLSQSPALADNLLSIILSKHPDLDTSNREQYFERLSPFYKRYTLQDRKMATEGVKNQKNELTEWEGLDLRILIAKLQSVRAFPKSNVPFGIDFSNGQNEPQSMVILGANAIGKSSIYDALEFSFCQRIGEALLRTSQPQKDGSDYFKKYLQHFDNPFSDSICELKLKGNKFFQINKENIPQAVRNKINPNSHFVSDYDIYETGQLNFTGNTNDSFQNLIANRIGLTELLQKEKELFGFSGYARKIETNRRNNLEREINNSQEIIKKNNLSIVDKTQLLNQFREGEVSLNNTKRIRNVLQLIEQLRSSKINFSYDFEESRKVASEFSLFFDEFINTAVKTSGLSQIQFLNDGLKLLNEEHSCPICNNSKSSKDEIKEHLEEKIRGLESFNKLSGDLNRASNNLTVVLTNLNLRLISNRSKVVSEISLLKEYEELNDLTILENNFLSEINQLYSQDIFTQIQKLESNEINGNSRLKYQREIIGDNLTFLEPQIKAFSAKSARFEADRNDKLNEVESEAKQKLQVNSKEGEIAILTNEISQLQNQITTEQKSIASKNDELIAATEVVELYLKIKNDTRKYANEFHRELTKEIKAAFDPIQSIVKNVLDKYLYLEERPATLKFEMKPESWDEETGEVISEIITAYIEPLDKSQGPQEVNKYFNTFHYRLFCTMVSISIAVASRKKTGINLPLVLDDVFYASDFENRTTIEEFVVKLFKIFKEFTPDQELQLILFTHDQLIFESIIKASRIAEIENIVFSKLFKHDESNLRGDYKNLVYRMPAYLPYSLTQNAAEVDEPNFKN